MKKILIFILSVCLLGCLTACDESNSSTSTATTEKTYSVGETANVTATYGKYNLTITSVEESTARNDLADSQPEKIVIVHYAYENIDCTQDITISNLYFHVYDADGNLLTVYPSTAVESPNTISAGGKKTASVAYGLNSKTNSLKLQFYNVDYSDMAHPECTFNLTW